MNKRFSFFILAAAVVMVAVIATGAQEVYTGAVVSYGGGIRSRLSTGTFTLTIDRHTSDERAQRLLGMLQEGADESLLTQIDSEDVGRFSINGRVGPRLNIVRETMIDGKRRIFAVFRRWMNFGEVRGGYRSTDYPYGVIELYIDPQTGKGEGTYVAAAKIRWHADRKTGQTQIEIENFATYPAQLMGVTQRGRVSRQ
jgi:hypothetical protein